MEQLPINEDVNINNFKTIALAALNHLYNVYPNVLTYLEEIIIILFYLYFINL